jgi:hypothetical protein
MAETDINIQEIAQQVLNYLLANSTTIEGLPQTSDLQNLELAPVLRYENGTLVAYRIAVNLLRGPVGATPAFSFSVETLPAGSQAIFEKTGGTNEAPAIRVGIPAGHNGENPQLRFTESGIEWKYVSGTEYNLLVPIDSIKLKFSDLTVADIEELQQPAQEAIESANTAAELATAKATLANQAASLASEAASLANAKATEANTAKENANIAAENTAATIENVESATASANDAAATASQAAQEAAQAAETAEAVIENANAATDRMIEIANHRDKIIDGEWWHWNEDTEQYENTGETAKGNVLYALLEIDPETGILYQAVDSEYQGAEFIVEGGILYSTITNV